jgi:hypothetical protein
VATSNVPKKAVQSKSRNVPRKAVYPKLQNVPNLFVQIPKRTEIKRSIMRGSKGCLLCRQAPMALHYPRAERSADDRIRAELETLEEARDNPQMN